MARKKKVEEMSVEAVETGLPDVLDEQPEPEVEDPGQPEVDEGMENYDPGPERPEPDDRKGDWPEPEPEPVMVPDFPLEEGHYFHTPVLSPRGHSEHPGVAVLRAHLGVKPVDSEVFDSDVLVAVQSEQKDMGEPMSGVVDAESWGAILSR